MAAKNKGQAKAKCGVYFGVVGENRTMDFMGHLWFSNLSKRYISACRA